MGGNSGVLGRHGRRNVELDEKENASQRSQNVVYCIYMLVCAGQEEQFL